MTTINFSANLQDADGKDISPIITQGKLLSDMIMGASINDEPMKYFDWALQLRKSEGILLLDDSDIEKLSNFIKNSGALTTLGKGRLLQSIKNGEEVNLS